LAGVSAPSCPCSAPPAPSSQRRPGPHPPEAHRVLLPRQLASAHIPQVPIQEPCLPPSVLSASTSTENPPEQWRHRSQATTGPGTIQSRSLARGCVPHRPEAMRVSENRNSTRLGE
jgi:hypothetical protein